VRQVWLSRRAIRLHVVILVVVPSFAALCIWQVHRALSGNTLSWAYVFEWPFFGGYAIYMWWRFVHEPFSAADGAASAFDDRPPGDLPRGDTVEAEDDPELAAYNRYLAALAAQDERRRSG
jgi:hypothetical protein